MIDYEQLLPLLEALEDDDDPAHHRLLVEALVALPLSGDAWRGAAPAVHRWLIPLLGEDPIGHDDAQLAARVPLRSVRRVLHAMSSDPDSANARSVALALAEVGDATAVPTLLHHLAQGGDSEVARALAILPLQAASDVTRAQLQPGLQTLGDDEGPLAALWTAIALARLGDFEPLEQLWDALVRPPDFFARASRPYLFRGPPPLFHGDPSRTVGALTRARPLPDRAVRFVLGLRGNDYDAQWAPKDPALVGDARNAILFVAGLTGTCNPYGDPMDDTPPVEASGPPETARATETIDAAETGSGNPNPNPGAVADATRIAVRLRARPWRGLDPNADHEEMRLLRHAPAELSAEVLESGIEQLDVALAEREQVPPYALGNSLVSLAAALPRRIPVRVARALGRAVAQWLPIESIAWVLGRAGADALVQSLSPHIVGSAGGQRAAWLAWLGHVARQENAPAPYLGAGGDEAAPALVTELVDDQPEKMGRTEAIPRELTGATRGAGAPDAAAALDEAPGRPAAVPAPVPAPTREVFPDIEATPAHPVAGASLTLTVSLGMVRSTTTGGSVHVPARDPDTVHTLRVHLLLGDHSAWDTLEFSLAGGTRKAATFSLTAPAVSGERALATARVNFYLNHRWCGEAMRALDVRRDEGVPQRAAPPIPPPPPWRNGLALEGDAVPPDLIVRILRGADVGMFTWTCQSPHLDLVMPADPRATQMALGSDAATFVRRAFEPVANKELRELDTDKLQGVFEALYRNAPDHFKDSYWAVWQAAAAGDFTFDSIQFITDEPFVPWELMRVFDKVRGPGIKAEVLAIRHSVGRWLASESAGPPQRIPVRDVVVAASDYVGISAVGNELPWAKEERERLVTKHHATPVALRSADVNALLKTGRAQAVHFACHGRMSIAAPDESTLVMEDTPDDVTPPLVARAEVCEGLGMQRPLVFLNACQVGAAGAALSLVAGFPAAFLYAGASALISPLWVVNDKRASTIAEEFYDAVLTPGGHAPLGQLLRDVRAKWTTEHHLTYLAYALYGDPLAWVDYTPNVPPVPQRPEDDA